MSELSPAAQAVLTAFNKGWDPNLPAAIRAAADQVVPLSYEDVWIDGRILQYEKYDPIRDKLFAIADELESL